MRLLVYVCVILLLAGCGQISIEWHMYRAEALEKKGNGAEAAAEYTKAAELGDIDAMIHLGGIFISGLRGVPKSSAKAEGWFIRCAELNRTECMEVLGLIYWSGFTGEADPKKAEYWLVKATHHGSTSAADSLAKLRAGERPTKLPKVGA